MNNHMMAGKSASLRIYQRARANLCSFSLLFLKKEKKGGGENARKSS